MRNRNTNYFFTADEHYDHYNVIKYNNRPWASKSEMNEALIENHNRKVPRNGITIHCGDFHWAKRYDEAQEVIKRLNGQHVFIRGSHDTWMRSSGKFYHDRWSKTVNGQYIVADHYAGRVWPRSHYGSWLVYGHSHGNLESFGKSYDVGVDNNNYEPVSFDELVVIMDGLDDNFNYIPPDKRFKR